MNNTAVGNMARRLVHTYVAVPHGGPQERVGHDTHPNFMQHVHAHGEGAGASKSAQHVAAMRAIANGGGGMGLHEAANAER